jgi:hypothetical protein
MLNLALVKNDVNKIKPEIRTDLPEWAKTIYSICDKPGLNIIKYWEGKDAELKEIAHRELMLIEDSVDLSVEKMRLFDKASKAFQIFIDAEDIKSESKKRCNQQRMVSFFTTSINYTLGLILKCWLQHPQYGGSVDIKIKKAKRQ